MCVLLFAVSAICDTNDNVRNDEVTVTVNTVNGQVRGHRQYTLFEQKLFYAFKGIPYARPPVGSLRFKVCFLLYFLVSVLCLTSFLTTLIFF